MIPVLQQSNAATAKSVETCLEFSLQKSDCLDKIHLDDGLVLTAKSEGKTRGRISSCVFQACLEE